MITSHSAFQATLPQLFQATSGTIATTPTLGLPLVLGVLAPGNLEEKWISGRPVIKISQGVVADYWGSQPVGSNLGWARAR